MPTRAKGPDVTIPEPLELAWVAGFIDGEGFVGMHRCTHEGNKRDYFQLLLDVAQARPEPIERLQQYFGGKVTFRRNAGNGAYYWRLYGDRAARTLQQLLPYLLVKRQQTILGLEFQATLLPPADRKRVGHGWYQNYPQAVHDRRSAIYAALRVLNHRRTQAERLSEAAPAGMQEDATVRSHGKSNHEKSGETPARLSLVG